MGVYWGRTERPNQPQTLTGIETIGRYPVGVWHEGPNQPQTLTGIETFCQAGLIELLARPNQPQTLTGIETNRAQIAK